MAIYFIQNTVTLNVKIGYSKDVQKRLRQLQQGNDCPLVLLAQIDGGPDLERSYHQEWHEYRVVPLGAHGDEWFSIGVVQTSSSIEISGLKKHRPPLEESKKVKKAAQLCLRLTDPQFEIIQRYKTRRGFKTEAEALRHVIDDLESWIKQRTACGSPSPERH